MSCAKIVLADTDESYLLPLEHRFVKGFGENAELVVISDQDYFESYFSTPQQADILVIGEAWFSRTLERHDLANVFILSEEDGTVAGELNAKRIDKYIGAQDIFLEVHSSAVLRHYEAGSENRAKVIMTYSPVGGAGTTSLSIGLCGAIARNRKKVLFVSIEGLQTAASFFVEAPMLTHAQKLLITDRSEGAYVRAKAAICTGEFDFFPLFQQALSAMNLKMTDYLGFFDLVKAGGEYDYIIVDAPREFSGDLSVLMGYADFTVIVAMQDAASTNKLEGLLRNINADAEKFLFVCGRHKADEEDCLSKAVGGRVRFSAHIAEEKDFPETAKELASLKSIQRLPFLFA